MDNRRVVYLVKPVRKASSQGRHLQSMEITRDGSLESSVQLHKTKATTSSGISCADEYVFKMDSFKKKFNAGMSELVPNPFYKEDSDDDHVNKILNSYNLNSDKWRSELEQITKQQNITKQRELEIKCGYDPNSLTEEVPKKNAKGFVDPTNQTIISKFKYKFKGSSNIIKGETPRDLLAIQLIKSRPDVIARDLQSVNPSMHNWYVAEEQETFKISKRRNDLVNEAIATLFEIQKTYPLTAGLEQNVLYQISSICKYKSGQPLVKGRVSNVYLEDKINKYLKKVQKDQPHHAQTFLDNYDLFKNNKNMFYAKFIVQQGFNTRSFIRSNGYIFWQEQKGKPEWYKFSTTESLEAFIFAELDKYQPDEPHVENAFADLLAEVKAHNAGVGIEM